MADDENREFLLRTKTRDASIDSLDSTKTINGTHDAIMNVIMLNEKKIKKNITLSLCVIFFYIIIGKSPPPRFHIFFLFSSNISISIF